jgi:peptidoglycan/LPS O-acetylase OafA/YrhL
MQRFLAVCAVVAVLALLVARSAFSQGGSVAYLQWPSLAVASLAVVAMIVALVAGDRSEQ